MPRCPLDLLVAVLLTSLCHQGWAQQTLVIVTKEDLVEMTQEGLPESLIIKAVESADRVPTLQPKELTELVAKGVSTNVLEAAIERRRESPGSPCGSRRARPCPVRAGHADDRVGVANVRCWR